MGRKLQRRTKILEASIKVRVKGRFSRSRFTILEETGDDLLVLGDPWLREQNPDIDWKKRTLKYRARPSTEERTRAPCLRVVDSRTFEHMEAPWKRYDESALRKEKREVNKLAAIHEDPQELMCIAKTKIEEMDSNHEIRELESGNTKEHSQAYWKQLTEIKEKLPTEVKDFADVFCSED